MTWDVIHSDCIEAMAAMPENSVSAVVCDPPYDLTNRVPDVKKCRDCGRVLGGRDGTPDACPKCGGELYNQRSQGKGFMGKDWDGTGIAFNVATWQAVYRVLKPGGYLIAFGGTRTYHRMAVAIEDAGFVLHPMIGWVYGCLSDDTEILVDGQWAPYHKATQGKYALCYNSCTDTYQWEPIQELLTYEYSDTAYRIRSDHTDQIVSRNHRCLIERGGTYVFEYAEDAARQRQARVPVLEELPSLLQALPLPHTEARIRQEDVFTGLRGRVDLGQAESATITANDQGVGNVRGMRERVPEARSVGQKDQESLLFARVQRQGAGESLSPSCEHWSQSLDRKESCVLSTEDERSEQSRLEGRRDLLSQTRELQADQVCPVPGGVSFDGTQGRLRDGASAIRGSGAGSATTSQRGRSSHQPESARQSTGKSPTILLESRPQTVRASRYTRADLALIEPIHYQGIVWCVRVPSGAFVARRNGKVFVTGNSGFPKATNLSKQFDKRGENPSGWLDFAAAYAEAVKASAYTHSDIDRMLGIKSSSCYWARSDHRGGMPPRHHWERVRAFLDLPAEFERLYDEAEREVIGQQSVPDAKHAPPQFAGYNGPSKNTVIDVTAPATDLAKQWDGWYYGRQSMKPALEPICMAQKPPMGRMTDNVRQWGTGAVNIAATRVGTGGQLQWAKPRDMGYHGGSDAGSVPALKAEHGRWPSNLLFSHHPACVPLGERRVKGSAPMGPNGGHNKAAYSGGYTGEYASRGTSYTDADGYEFVTAWQCHEQCPVRVLGEQSGESRSPNKPVKQGGHHRHDVGLTGDTRQGFSVGYGDQGNASRFFPTFAPEVDAPFIYQAKSSRRERNAGLEGLPERAAGAYGEFAGDGRGRQTEHTPAANHHPTVKPVALMRWLCRLVTPPGGLVLDPFCGSGSTGMAALLEGFSFVGVEQDAEYVTIARARIAHVERHGEKWLTAKATPIAAPAALPEPSQPTTMQQTMFPLEEAS